MKQWTIGQFAVIVLATTGGATAAALPLAALGLSVAWVAAASAVCGLLANQLASHQLEAVGGEPTAQSAASS